LKTHPSVSRAQRNPCCCTEPVITLSSVCNGFLSTNSVGAFVSTLLPLNTDCLPDKENQCQQPSFPSRPKFSGIKQRCLLNSSSGYFRMSALHSISAHRLQLTGQTILSHCIGVGPRRKTRTFAFDPMETIKAQVNQRI